MVEPKDPPGSSKPGLGGKPHERPRQDGGSQPSSGRGGGGGSGGAGLGNKPPDKPPVEPGRTAGPPPSNTQSPPPSNTQSPPPGNTQSPPPPSNSNQYNAPPPNVDIPMGAWRAMDLEERQALWLAYQKQQQQTKPGAPPKPNINVPPPGSNIPMPEWRAMDADERAAAWGAPPPGISIAQDKWDHMSPDERAAIWSGYSKGEAQAPAQKPGGGTKPNLDVPPPGSDIPMGAWRAMDEEERAALWAGAKAISNQPKPDGDRRYRVPPPECDIPMSVWRTMDDSERKAEWEAYNARHGGGAGGGPPKPEDYKGNQIDLNVPPPGSGYTMLQWRQMELERRAVLWAEYYKRLRLGVRPGEQIVNEALLEFLNTQRDENGNPFFVTVQDLINQDPTLKLLADVCKKYGLDQSVLNRYRGFPLRYFAVIGAPPQNGAPNTVSDANKKYFITQYYNELYNSGSPSSGASSNCGPTSLAMVLRVLGKMPPALLASSPEDQIDYLRALMKPGDARIKPRKIPAPPPDGSWVDVLDADSETTGFGGDVGGSQGAARALGLTDATRQSGWDKFATAVVARGQPVVLAGVITPAWQQLLESKGGDGYGGVSSNAVDHYIAILGRTSDGGFIVADPMFAGGTVVLSLEELGTFPSNPKNPEFLNPDPK